ncbi:site-specific integrase [Bacillaceae bacterium IKA-2]|nr:site-specific integrase [Bacillaceae bacterium IKA-2]WNF35232.1 site-specific integrase [Bacillaceae bacterium IKA-2]WNF35296.1 site-specific integrase [Bacillaceae bacterium IKA-2]WNF35678.1 site-specific integrase [Bacillaceae bacterium IKA-2]WNF35891.1 site-specific integrase [Bacillaceae bacterium IKA-2]
MEQKYQTFEQLSSEVVKSLRDMSYSESRISQYRSAWQKLATFMENNQIEYYSASVGGAFIADFIGTGKYEEFSHWEKSIIRCVDVLTEFQSTGTFQYRRAKKSYQFYGCIGNPMVDFLNHRKSLGITENTLGHYRLNLHRFLSFFNEEGVMETEAIKKQHILGFVNQLGFYTPATRHSMLTTLRGFMRYLHDNGYTGIDFSYLIPKDNYKKQCKLPTTYTKNEVESLINTVDRSSPKGKRDAAMILLAARLGLRASDICLLKFENIHWEKNTITLVQQKTKNKIEHPLLIEIGEAIIDYLKYGRPKSDLPYVFLHAIPPYNCLNRSTLHSIVTFYLRRAGIKNITEKKHGPHALRHSLAGQLLEQKIPIHVISEVLGHKNTESTKTYLRIDLTSLSQCALDVPLLKTPFYAKEVE